MKKIAIHVIAVGLLSGCVGLTERQMATTPVMAAAIRAGGSSYINAEVTERAYHSITSEMYDAPMLAQSSPIIYSAPAGEPCVAGVANSSDCRTGKISQVAPTPPTGSNGKPCPPSKTGGSCVISIGASEAKPSIQSPGEAVTNYYRISNDNRPFVPAVTNELTPEQKTMVYNTAYEACLREKQTGRTPFSTNCDEVAKDSVAHTVSSGPAMSSTTPTQLSQQQKSTIYNNAYSSCVQRNQANCASVASNAVTAASNPVTTGNVWRFSSTYGSNNAIVGRRR